MKVTNSSPASRPLLPYQQATIRIGQAAQRGGESRAKQAHSQSLVKTRRSSGMTIKFVFLFSRQGKLRLAKWFNSYPEKVPNQSSCMLTRFFLAGQEETDSRCDFSRFGSRPQDVLLHRVQGRPQNCLQALCQVHLGAFWKGET